MMSTVSHSFTPMNKTVTFPARPPVLKLTRAMPAVQPTVEKMASSLTEERRRLQEDHDALRLREENLRHYEARLRALQDEIEAGRGAMEPTARTAAPFLRPASNAPFDSDSALQAAWGKLHRARELLESEQTHLRGERIATQEKENEVKRREKNVAERELRVAERERALLESAASIKAEQPIAAEQTMSAVARLTRSPFDMARSVFGGKK